MSSFVTGRSAQSPLLEPHPSVEPRRRGAILVDVGAGNGEGIGSGIPAEPLATHASALSSTLPEGWQVFSAQGEGLPTVTQVLEEMVEGAFDDLVVVPLWPQFSRTTTGEVVKELYHALESAGLHLNVATRTSWFDDIGYINAQARLIAEHVSSLALTPQNAQLLFVAPGLPAHSLEIDDPYQEQVERTAELISQRLGWPMDSVSVSFQPGAAEGEWLHPAPDESLREAGRTGVRRVLVCPLLPSADGGRLVAAFGPQVAATADEAGLELIGCDTLGSSEPFITALKNVVLRGPQRVPPTQPPPEPLLSAPIAQEPRQDRTEALVMVGASLANGLHPAHGPALHFSEPEAFSEIKKHRKAILEFLDGVRERDGIDEAFVWNTCQREELYFWLSDPGDRRGRDDLVRELRSSLFGAEPDGLRVNVLFGSDAWHHLVRTASGLNSDLPGDTDVLAQLQTACRVAEHAETVGPLARSLVDRASELTNRVRSDTPWGAFSTGFCHAALQGVQDGTNAALETSSHVIIGGSTTSRSVLSSLTEEFGVPHRLLTVIYRCHHGQMKLLRAAVGNGRRLRVHSYSEDAVVRVIAGADVVYFGIDHPEPVLDAAVLAGLRDYQERPLTIVDFNSFGSMVHSDTPDGVTIWSSKELDRAVAAYAEEMTARHEFSQAAEEAGRWIEDQVPQIQGMPEPPPVEDTPC
ncbi:ferrochelatase [Gemmatimonadota bacterium]